MNIMNIHREIMLDIMLRWNKRFRRKLQKDELDIIDLTIRISFEKIFKEIKDEILSKARISADYKTNKNLVNLSTLEFIINKL